MTHLLTSLSRQHIAIRTASSLGFVTVLIVLVAPLQHFLNVTTIGFALLLCVLFIAIHMGSRPAFAACFVAMLGYNFFFLPPILTLTIKDPQNWVALVAFSITAIVTGHLSASARQRATEAERSKQEAERLYQELKAAFELASQAEAIKRSELMKSALLDAVTHDLRTPLTAIRAAATTLRRAQRTAQDITMELTAELVTLVDEESLHLDQLIGGLVELARIESGKLLLTTTWSSLRDVTNAAIQRATNALKEHHVVVEMQETLPLLHIDARALSEVIYTLLDNARKYSPVGSVITIRAEAKNEVIEVSVHDEGVGIREGDAERVFDKFYRVEDVRSNAPGGLGIGLSIAKAIVEAHRGAICVAPDRGGKGTALVFRIPVQREA